MTRGGGRLSPASGLLYALSSDATQTGALMATGWAREGAVQEQIDSTVQDAVERARRQLSHGGQGLSHCEECGEAIPARRREAIPGVRLCVACQSERDKAQAQVALYNRRGSKDSQLR